MRKMTKKLLPVAAAFALCMNLAYGIVVGRVSAATLTNTYIRTNRMKTNEDTSFRVVFRTVGAGATSVTINFQSAWTTANGSVNATQTVTGTAGCDVSATALPGSLTAAGSGTTVTISNVTALSATTTYCVDLTSSTAINLPDAGEYYPVVTAGSDSVTTAVRIVADDQVVVSAAVAPSFNFVLGANTTSFTANLDSSNVRATTGVTATVTTNATNGWVAWVRDSNAGLTSAAASKTIATSGTINGAPTTLSAGTEGYVLDVDETSDPGGTVTVDAEYNGGANAGGTLSNSAYQPIGVGTQETNGDVLTLIGRAAIAGSTPAATDYTDTWTVIGAGNF